MALTGRMSVGQGASGSLLLRRCQPLAVSLVATGTPQ